MIAFELNGQPVTSASEADTPLLWVVRDELKLKGTKFNNGGQSKNRMTIIVRPR